MKRFAFFIPLVIALITTSCFKDPISGYIEDDQDTWVYKTTKATNVNYSAYSTFSVVDSLVYIDGSGMPKKTSLNSADIAARNAVISNMEARGYTYVENIDFSDTLKTPDLVFNLAKINVATAYIYNGWYDWCDYWYWYYPYYSCYYSPTYFYDYDVVQAYVVDMIDTKKYNQNQSLPPSAIWHALFTGYDIFSTTAETTFINEAFKQSNYIRK